MKKEYVYIRENSSLKVNTKEYATNDVVILDSEKETTKELLQNKYIEERKVNVKTVNK